jgi:hypothetical protein
MPPRHERDDATIVRGARLFVPTTVVERAPDQYGLITGRDPPAGYRVPAIDLGGQGDLLIGGEARVGCGQSATGLYVPFLKETVKVTDWPTLRVVLLAVRSRCRAAHAPSK